MERVLIGRRVNDHPLYFEHVFSNGISYQERRTPDRLCKRYAVRADLGNRLF